MEKPTRRQSDAATRRDGRRAVEQQAATFTFEQLAAREPRLTDLRAEISAVRDDGRAQYFCANEHWYGYGYRGFKDELSRLIGWGRDPVDPALSTSAAWDVAYRELYKCLPDCRRCGCVDPRPFLQHILAASEAPGDGRGQRSEFSSRRPSRDRVRRTRRQG
jgi:hypothetical protein